jgi:serine/threonine-protein kinase/endoribonuclease IRE1
VLHSVAVFDVVKSTRRQSPFVLLQPRLRLQDMFPSATHQHDYPFDDSAFVGLVPGTGSLYALSPDHFPLVAFSESAPPQSVESVEGIEGVLVSTENGMLQCFDGTTDRRCLTGVRALRADSRSRLARLLDGVPGPATPPLPSANGGPAHPDNTNSQAYAGSEPHGEVGEGQYPVVPWEWLAGVPESLAEAQRQKSWGLSPSAVLLALVSVVASFLWFNRNVPAETRNATMPNELAHSMAAAKNAVSITPPEFVDGATRASHLESQAGENGSSAKATPPEDSLAPMKPPSATPVSLSAAPATDQHTPLSSSTTDGKAKDSPVKAESSEGAEEAGEVKKKHRKRRRKRKGDGKDAAAEVEEPENEDGEGGEGGEDGNAVSASAPSAVPSTAGVPPASSSLVISDTVLGMLSNPSVPEIHINQNQVMVRTALLSIWAPCRAVQWLSNDSSETLSPLRTVKSASSRTQTTTQMSFDIITKSRMQAFSTLLLNCALPRLRTSLSGLISSARSPFCSTPSVPYAKLRLASDTCMRLKLCTEILNHQTSSSRVQRKGKQTDTGC